MSDENTLIVRAKQGEMQAFEELIAQYQQQVFNIAYRMCGNYDDASDMAQEALVKVYKNINKFEGKAKFSTWLYRLTTNVCLDEIKKKSRRKVISLDEEIQTDDGAVVRSISDTAPGMQEELENKELRLEVNEAILKLTPKYRQIVVLRDIEGFSYEEMAEVLKCSLGTVKSRVSRARLALAKILKNSKLLDIS